MTIAEILRNAARKTDDWAVYGTTIGMGANQLIPAIREMERRGFEASEVATVLRHIADKLSPPKRKSAKK